MNNNIFENFPEFTTNRLKIRQMSYEDYDIVYDFNSCHDSLKFIVREPFSNEKEAKDKLNSFLNGINEKTALWWTFILKETGEKIGYGGLFDISFQHKRAEIGYGLTKKFWAKGYMSEILKAILDFGLKKVKFHKIYGIVIPGNNASIKLLENNGFVKEAHLKDHSFARGKYFDETIYSILNKTK